MVDFDVPLRRGDDDTIRIIAIDPSLNNLGVAVGEVSLTQPGKVHVIFAGTFLVEKWVDRPKVASWLSLRSLHADSVTGVIVQVIRRYDPMMAVSEQPVYKGNPVTHGHQWEGICAIRTGVIACTKQRDLQLTFDLELLHPGDMKAIFGVARNNGDKSLITDGLLREIKAGNLSIAADEFHPSQLDEHAQDAEAMLLVKANNLLCSVA